MKSIWENSLWFRIFILIIWLFFIGALNFLVFWPFLWYKYNFNLVLIIIFVWILYLYLVKYFKYFYEIQKNNLYIKTPYKKKVYELPFSDIQKIAKISHMPFIYKFWIKFDANNNILYLTWFSSRWILISLQTHDIVISPRQFDLFYEKLKEKI